jgi:hypothetical protein
MNNALIPLSLCLVLTFFVFYTNFTSRPELEEVPILEEEQIEVFNIPYTYYLERDPLLNAIAFVESGYDTTAIGDFQDYGLLQITPIMVKEINRILRQKGDTLRYTLDDRRSPIKSIEMYYIYHGYYNNEHPEEIARSWNSGPKWESKKHLTDQYWEKVQDALEVAL